MHSLIIILSCHVMPCGRLDVAGGYSDAPGVTVTAPGFGSTSSVEFIGSDMPYMNELVDYFVQRGYVRNVNIRAAPYDWRLAAGMWS